MRSIDLLGATSGLVIAGFDSRRTTTLITSEKYIGGIAMKIVKYSTKEGKRLCAIGQKWEGTFLS